MPPPLGGLLAARTRPAACYHGLLGAPYSARTVVREYVDLFAVSDQPWLTVTTIVEDTEYLTTAYVTSSNFKKQADATGWNPTGCD